MANSIVYDGTASDLEYALDPDGTTAVFQGDIVVIDTDDGYAYPGSTNTGLRAKGIAKEAASIANGDLVVVAQISDHTRGVRYFKLKSVAGGHAVGQDHVGSNCYIEDAKTVTMETTGRSVCGEVFRIDPDDGDPWVIFPR